MATKRSQGAHTYGLVRRDMLGGALKPGTRLRYAEMCTRYVRDADGAVEALTRHIPLTADMLLDVHAAPAQRQDLSVLVPSKE
jgi:hypothetical protein